MRSWSQAITWTLLLLPSLAQAEEDLVNFIPNGLTPYFGERQNCKICHVRPQGDGERNAFGEAYGAAPGLFFRWPNLYNLDSDGDGQTNGEELGDPEGVWRPRQPAPRAWPISLPGDPSSTSNLDGDAGPPPDFGTFLEPDAGSTADGSAAEDAGRVVRDAGVPAQRDAGAGGPAPGGGGCQSVPVSSPGWLLLVVVGGSALRRRLRA